VGLIENHRPILFIYLFIIISIIIIIIIIIYLTVGRIRRLNASHTHLNIFAPVFHIHDHVHPLTASKLRINE